MFYVEFPLYIQIHNSFSAILVLSSIHKKKKNTAKELSSLVSEPLPAGLRPVLRGRLFLLPLGLFLSVPGMCRKNEFWEM